MSDTNSATEEGTTRHVATLRESVPTPDSSKWRWIPWGIAMAMARGTPPKKLEAIG